MLQTFGKLLPTPGTPLRATTNQPVGLTICHGILIQALPTNVGKVYIGSATMSRTSLDNLHAVLPVPSTTVIPSWAAALALAPNAIDAAGVFIDVDSEGDGVTVSVLVT